MTLSDIAKVVWRITEVDMTVRDLQGNCLHKWLIGDVPEYLGQGLVWDIAAGKVTVVRKPINYHGQPVRGVAEIAWGLMEKEIPKELLNATVIHLDMSYPRNGITINLEVEMDELTWQAVKGWGEDGKAD